MEKDIILKKLSELRQLLRDEFNVKEIGYFGSFARNENTQGSDIDILVDFTKPLGWKFFVLQELLESNLGRKVDLVSRKALKKQLREQILKEVQYIE